MTDERKEYERMKLEQYERERRVMLERELLDAIAWMDNEELVGLIDQCADPRGDR